MQVLKGRGVSLRGRKQTKITMAYLNRSLLPHPIHFLRSRRPYPPLRLIRNPIVSFQLPLLRELGSVKERTRYVHVEFKN